MIKKISYFVFTLILSSIVLVNNVKADTHEINYDFMSRYSEYLTDDDLIFLDNYITTFNRTNNVYYNACSLGTNSFNSYASSAVIICSNLDFDYIVFYQSYLTLYYNTDTDYQYNRAVFYYNINSKEITHSLNNNSGMFRVLGINDTSSSVFFWFEDGFIPTDLSFSYKINDDVYNSMSADLKKYYDFQDYILNDKPLYSYINLRLGNFKGPVVEVDYTINYYYDDVLQEDLTETKRDLIDKLIVLEDLDEVVDDIYFLDKTRVYRITLKPYEENVINVYYYSIDMNYNVNIYLDDIYYQSHSYVGVAKLGSEVVLEDLLETINIYTLDEREYKLSVNENPQLNYINVYYYSDNYDTKYQDIDTSDKFYISFDWVYIKELFELKGNYTQTEQFLIVYCVNILFYVIVGLFIYIGLKMLNKLFSFIRMF